MSLSSARSASRLILLVSIAISVLWVGSATWYGPSGAKSHFQTQASQDYYSGNHTRAAEGYGAIIALEDSVSKRVVKLREQATAYGHAGDYKRQLEKNLAARDLASQHGLDSLASEAEESIGNIIAVCARDTFDCPGIDMPTAAKQESDDFIESSLGIPVPVFVLLIGFAAVGFIFLIAVETP